MYYISGQYKRISSSGDFCKPKFGNFDGNGLGPGERWETKGAFFQKYVRIFRLRGLEPNKLFFRLAGSSLPT